MKTTYKIYLYVILIAVFVVSSWPGLVIAFEQQPISNKDSTYKHFKIQVVDRQTGRGVPLVELRTVNNIRYFTDSNGIVAFYEPGLMEREVYFYISSHGYKYPPDFFGNPGRTFKVTKGDSALIKIKRINVAERLYRFTGEGLYHHSLRVGHSIPVKQPVINAKIVGLDATQALPYKDKIYWTWGDTGKLSYALGHFAVSGATEAVNPAGLESLLSSWAHKRTGQPRKSRTPMASV